MKHSLALLAALVLTGAWPSGPAIAGGYVDLEVGITGSNDLSGLDDPVTVLMRPEVGHLMQDLADKPRGARFIRDKLRGSPVDLARLQSLRLIRKSQAGYVIDFPYYTAEDHDRILTRLKPYASSFASRFVARWDDFKKIFSAYDVASVPDEAVAYAIIGAMSLDWDGLSITERRDLRTTAENLPQGQKFVVWAKETVSGDSLKGLYWGSHNEPVGGYWFTTFGDHAAGARRGLPDYLWRVGGAIRRVDGEPTDLSRAAARALEPYYSDGVLTDIGAVLIAMRDGAQTEPEIADKTAIDAAKLSALIGFLRELRYVRADGGKLELIVPVFGRQDKAMVTAARRLSWRIIDDWLAENYEPSRMALGDLTMMKYGVSYKDLYTQIWHYLFGMVNLELSKQGYFIDPYAETRAYKGFAPFMYLIGIYEDDDVIAGG